MLHSGPAFSVTALGDGIVEVKFDLAGESVNKINALALEDFDAATNAIARDPGIKGIVLTSGKEVFVVGADITEFSGRNKSGVYDPYFVQTEFEAIKSETVLTNVVTALDLQNKWGTNRSGGKPLKTSDALELLRSRIELKPVKNTMFTEIMGKSSDPKEAAAIANAVAEAYQQHRLAEIKRASEGGIRALEERFEEQQAKVAPVQRRLKALVRVGA